MKVFFDTNILLDVLLEREPFYEKAAILWSIVEKEKITGYISAISVNNIFYIARKYKGQENAEKIIDIILEIFTVIPLDYEILKLARTKELKDYEDLIQYFSALKSGAKYITTRNKKDFPKECIELVDAEEFLNIVKREFQKEDV